MFHVTCTDPLFPGNYQKFNRVHGVIAYHCANLSINADKKGCEDI